MLGVTLSYGMLLVLVTFFVNFYNDHSRLKYCIFIKLSHTICLISTYILICQYGRCDYRLMNGF